MGDLDIANYADGNIPCHTCSSKFDVALEKDINNKLHLFSNS